MRKNILQLLEDSAQKYPNRRAFSDTEGAIIYKDVVEQSKAIGTYFIKKELRQEPIAIVMDRKKENLVAFWGVVYSGNFYVPIDPSMPEVRVKSILDILNPSAILVDAKNREKVENWNYGVPVVDYDTVVSEKVKERSLAQVRREMIDRDLVYALFTSGSTGVPKGVAVCHRSLIDYADWIVETLHITEETVFGGQAPFYFSMSVFEIMGTIHSGAELHIIPKMLFSFPMKLVEHMNEFRVNTVCWIPSALGLMVNTKALDKVLPEYLHTIMFGAEAMPAKVLNALRTYMPNANYYNSYGPTEATDVSMCCPIEREFSDDEMIPTGLPCDNTHLFIINDDGEEVEPGEVGELYVRGSFVTMGYYNNPEKTAEVFVQNPLNTRYSEIVYRTGDLFSTNEHGEYLFHGRKDYQIKHQGYRIELGEIEAAIHTIKEIEECICVYNQEKDQIVLFYKGQNVTPAEIRNGIKNIVPTYMIPNVMKCVEEIPHNANGKADRKRVMKLL